MILLNPNILHFKLVPRLILRSFFWLLVTSITDRSLSIRYDLVWFVSNSLLLQCLFYDYVSISLQAHTCNHSFPNHILPNQTKPNQTKPARNLGTSTSMEHSNHIKRRRRKSKPGSHDMQRMRIHNFHRQRTQMVPNA